MTDDAIESANLDDLEWLVVDAAAEQRSGLYDDPNRWLPEWFLRKSSELDMAEKVIKEQAKRLLNQVKARRHSLWFHHGADFESQVRKDFAAQQKAAQTTRDKKRKSVTYMHGNAGFRASGDKIEVVVTDKVKASLALDKVCPEAVDYKIDTAKVKKLFKETGEVVDGIECKVVPSVDSFFPKPPEKHLLEEPKDED
jgi:hypothetical protein